MLTVKTNHSFFAVEANSDALFEFLVGGFGNHLTAASEYGLC